jgi:HEAT repeat protein
MKTSRFLLTVTLAASALATIATSASPDPQKTRQLIAVVQSDAPLFERARACQQLTIFGTREAVPVLAGLLADDMLSHYAREALEAMPDPSAGDALRAALGTLKGKLLVGAVNSIGMRRDGKAVEALGKLANEPGSGAATAALLALGRIATPDAARQLQQTLTRGPDELRVAAAEGCLLVADADLAAGRRDAAVSLYDAVRRASVPGQLRVTATRGAILARGAAGLPLLIEQLRSDDKALRDVGLISIRDLPGDDVTPALLAELPRATPAMQALIIPALVERDDARALGAIESKVGADSGEVRLAAIAALGRIGRSSSVPILLKVMTTSRHAAESEAALAALGRINAPDTIAAILQALPSAAPAARAKLIGVLGERKAESATGELLKLARDAEPEVSRAALRALALVTRPDDLPRLIELAVAIQDDAMKTLADRAIATTSMKVLEVGRRADAVLTAYRQATEPAARVSLIRPLGAIVRSMGSSHEAFFVMRAALSDPAEPVREAALRCLADWPDAAPSVTLLELALRADTPPAQREVALRGAIRMATNVAAGRDRSPLDALSFFTQANRAVKTTAEKLMIVSGLGSLRRFEAVQMLQPYLDDPAVKTEAALALVQVAPGLLSTQHGDTVKRLLEKVAAGEKDEDTRRKAARVAKGLSLPAGKQKGGAAAPAPASWQASPKSGPLFNGTDLAGWEGNPGVWRVRDGVIVGGTLEGNPRNEFLATTRSYRNFVLRLDYKLVGTEGFVNGGVQVRSVRLSQPAHEMSGYQADIGAGHTGSLYDESRRKKFLERASAEQIARLEESGDWNRYEVRCEGPRVEITLNGEKTLTYTESDLTLPQDGLIALQIHGKCKAEISFRNIFVEPLP